MLVVTDGAPGLIRAMEELWPDADRQRCTVHRLRNLVAKLPRKDTELRERVEASYWAALHEATSAADGEARLRQLVDELERPYPSAAACLAEDLSALCTHLEYPLRLRKRLRSTNLLERSLEEVKRRTKVIGRFPGETSCLSLCWAVLDLLESQRATTSHVPFGSSAAISWRRTSRSSARAVHDHWGSSLGAPSGKSIESMNPVGRSPSGSGPQITRAVLLGPV